MKNEDVVKSFYEGKPNERPSLSTNGYKLFSYKTVIAQKVVIDDKTKIIKNITKYSHTTSKHQFYIDNFDYVVTDVPKGATDLVKYM